MKSLNEDLQTVKQAIEVKPDAALNVLETIIQRRQKQHDNLTKRFETSKEELKKLNRLKRQFLKELNLKF